jgi:hypothetical protein
MRGTVDTNTLQYSPPSHGDWGIVRVAALVPESHLLFVCPSACGRHGALGAIQQGFKDRLSYIYIDRSDIIRGYAETIKSFIPQLLELLPHSPKALMIYVSCLDDLIGTDLDGLCAELESEHRNIRFRTGHMNPISLGSKAPPALTTQSAMFSFLEPFNGEKHGINLIGNLTAVPRENELYAFLDYCGATPVRHITDFETFDSFGEMAQSAANLVLSPIASRAAREMEQKHGQPFLTMFVSYDLDEIAENYRKLADFLKQGTDFDFSRYQAEAKSAIESALSVIGDTPIAVSGVLKPYGLASALLKYGFNVVSVMADDVIAPDMAAYEGLCSCGAGLRSYLPQHPANMSLRTECPDALALGFEAAYITGSRHIANVNGDHGMFGYNGVKRLMQILVEAKHREFDLDTLMDEYGVVV